MTRHINDGAQIFITVANQQQSMHCEICGVALSALPPHMQTANPPLPTAHSFMISYPMPGSQASNNPNMPPNAMIGAGVYEGYTCGMIWDNATQGFNNTGAVQHFGCTYEHAFLAAIICGFDHLHGRGQHGGQASVQNKDGSYVDADLEAIRQIVLKYMQ